MASFSLQFHYNSLHTTRHNAPYWLEWHCKPPPRNRCRRPALSASERWTNPRHQPPLPSMTPLPLCSKSTESIQPKPILTPASSIKDRFVAECDNKRCKVIGQTMGTSKGRHKKYWNSVTLLKQEKEDNTNRRETREGKAVNKWIEVCVCMYVVHVNWQIASSKVVPWFYPSTTLFFWMGHKRWDHQLLLQKRKKSSRQLLNNSLTFVNKYSYKE